MNTLVPADRSPLHHSERMPASETDFKIGSGNAHGGLNSPKAASAMTLTEQEIRADEREKAMRLAMRTVREMGSLRQWVEDGHGTVEIATMIENAFDETA